MSSPEVIRLFDPSVTLDEYVRKRILENLDSVLASGMTGEGDAVFALKHKLHYEMFDLYNHTKSLDSIVMTNSCTSALELACKLSLSGKKNKIYTTPFTMVATNTAASRFAKRLIFGDIEEESLALDLSKAMQWLGRNQIGIPNHEDVGAVIITLVAGVVPDGLYAFYKWCQLYDIKVIIDSAHSVLPTYVMGSCERPLFECCDFLCLSFQSIKQVICGDGGALIINPVNADLIERANRLKWFGLSRNVPEGMTRLEWQMAQDVEEAGFKYHMNNITAAIGCVTFDDWYYDNRFYVEENVEIWRQTLKDIPQVRIAGDQTDAHPSYWFLPLLVERRDELQKYLEDAGIQTSPMWRRNDEYTCFLKAEKPMPLDATTVVSDRILAVPNEWHLDKWNIEYIANSIKRFYSLC